MNSVLWENIYTRTLVIIPIHENNKIRIISYLLEMLNALLRKKLIHNITSENDLLKKVHRTAKFNKSFQIWKATILRKQFSV